jgi:hypothetical protein
MNIRIDGYITYTKYAWEDEALYNFYCFDPTGHIGDDAVVLMQHSFYVEVPDNFDPRPGQIAALKAKREKAQADFSKCVMEIDAKINELLAIEA